jgi:hypothetical protein
MLMRISKFFCVLGILFFVSWLTVPVVVAEKTNDQAISALASGEESMVSAYKAVLAAEKAGAKVTSIVIQLNRATDLLTEANASYTIGNYEEAITLANMGRSIGEEMQKTATVLGDSAKNESMQNLVFSSIESVVGIILVASVSLLIWRFLKKRSSDEGTPKRN